MNLEGILDINEMKKLLEKSQKGFKAYNLNEEDPSSVKEWISTGSRWLDSSIARGRMGGIPVGRITEIAGLESTGKSYMAAVCAGNAQKQGFNVYYFESENTVDKMFLEMCGIDLDKILYIPATSVEFVLETIKNIVSNSKRNFFVWDSLALTPCEADWESDFSPTNNISLKARVLSNGLPKLIQPIGDTDSALLVINQLKTNIQTGMGARTAMMVTPYVTPGGKSLAYSYSLRIWLTGRKAKDSFVYDEHNYTIGSEVRAKIEKSKFGTQRRSCFFKIIWGDYDNVGILDKESWLDAIKNSSRIKTGPWWKLLDKNDKELFSFRSKEFVEKLESDENFYKHVIEIMDEEVIVKFDEKSVDAVSFYEDLESDEN